MLHVPLPVTIFFTFIWLSGRLQLKQFPKFEARMYYLGLVIREHVVAKLIVVVVVDDDDAADDDDDDDYDDAADDDDGAAAAAADDDDDDDDDDDAVCSYFCCASYDILLVLVVGRYVFQHQPTPLKHETPRCCLQLLRPLRKLRTVTRNV